MILEENFTEKLTKSALSKEWDLIIDEAADDIYTWPLFNADFCYQIIATAEECNEWRSDRHEFYPTTDMNLDVLGVNEKYNEILREYVYPAAIHKYNLEGKTWKNLSFENFIVRYLPDEQSYLSLHHDNSKVTAITTLNSEYKGGGTFFEKQKVLLKNQTGNVSIHPGNITHRHGARPITQGVRYIVVTFSN
tara:strand:+ start:536 stop:1111 length:576 start_codon:yes stop_codon:yes gene_type:complete